MAWKELEITREFELAIACDEELSEVEAQAGAVALTEMMTTGTGCLPYEIEAKSAEWSENLRCWKVTVVCLYKYMSGTR